MQAEPAKPNDTAALLARIVDGNQAVWSELYQTVHVRVYAFALKQLNDKRQINFLIAIRQLDWPLRLPVYPSFWRRNFAVSHSQRATEHANTIATPTTKRQNMVGTMASA